MYVPLPTRRIALVLALNAFHELPAQGTADTTHTSGTARWELAPTPLLRDSRRRDFPAWPSLRKTVTSF